MINPELLLPVGQEALDEQVSVVGEDPWPNNLEDNRTDLEAALAYANELGIVADDVVPEDLFIPSSLERLPSYA
jgi:hypothetical protein